MSIWRTAATPEELNERGSRTLPGYLGIRVTEIGPDFLRATMPVTEHTHQPFGVLHGGASVALAETVGSLAAMLCIDPAYLALGQDINANHVRSVSAGLAPNARSTCRSAFSVRKRRAMSCAATRSAASRVTAAIGPSLADRPVISR